MTGLPANNTEWPLYCDNWAVIYKGMAEWDTWYKGSPGALASFYASQIPAIPGEVFYTSAGAKDRFYARQAAEKRATTIHVPIAGDICRTNASYLFGDPPDFKAEGADAEKPNAEAVKAQDWLNDYTQAMHVNRILSEAADVCAGLGGVIPKLDWDLKISDKPILGIVQPDCFIPTYQHGILTGALIWEEVDCECESHEVFRLLQWREKGLILNGLYRGTHGSLGVSVDLDSIEATRGIEPRVAHGIDDLLLRYIPNRKPNRWVRGCPLGMSDYAGVTTLMESLDETVTAMHKEIKLAQAHLGIPERMLRIGADGKPEYVMAQEGYMLPIEDGNPIDSTVSNSVQIFQPDMRIEQYRLAIEEYITTIVTMCGYSPQSFGQNIEGNAQSGTALNIRENRSYGTAASKAEYYKPAIQDILRLAMEIDNKILGNRKAPIDQKVVVEMKDGIRPDPLILAQTIATLGNAGFMSKQRGVELFNQDMERKDRDAEVKRLEDSQGMNVPDPTKFGQGNVLPKKEDPNAKS